MKIGNFYISKTILFFVLAFATAVANEVGFSDYELDPEMAVMFTSLAGIFLRSITKRPLVQPESSE